MKNSILLSACIFFTLSTIAQKEPTGFDLGFSPEAGMPLSVLKNGYQAGYGLSGKVAYNFNRRSALTFQTGYLSFVAHEDYKDYAEWARNTSFKADPSGFVLVPFKTGFQYKLSNIIFVEPQIGATALSSNKGAKFTFAVNAGVFISPAFVISARYEEITATRGSLSFVGLNAGYSFKFKH